MKWPYKVRARKSGPVLLRIYRPCEGRESYRVAWQAGGQRMMKSFKRFAGPGGALEFGRRMAGEIARGSQVPTLTAAEARSALAIRDALDSFRQQTGNTVTAIQAVTEYLSARRRLGDRTLPEAVDGFLSNVATITPKSISAAVEEFIGGRAAQTKSREGKRANLSANYAYITALWLRNFAREMSGHLVRDLTKAHLDLYMADPKRAGLAPKSRNHIRGTLKMFIKWAVRRDYLSANHRLLDAEGMRIELADGAETEFYRPKELRKLLDTASEDMRPIIALCALAGLRQQEALRLTWQEVFGTARHVEVTAAKSKTRSRRLVAIVPALAAWLRPFRQKQGPVWSQSEDTFQESFAALREACGVPARRNGLRHAFCTYHFALHANENLTAQQAGNSPAMVHKHYKGLATKPEAKRWFAVRPAKQAGNIITLPDAKGAAA